MQRNVSLLVRSQRVGCLELDAPEEKWKPVVFTHFPSLWPSCTFSPQKFSRLFHKNMSIATRETKLKLKIPRSRNYLCVNICWWQHWTSRLCRCPQAQIQHLCATRQSCFVTISLFMTPPHTHTHKVEHTWFWHEDNGGLAANEIASYVKYYLSNLSN